MRTCCLVYWVCACYSLSVLGMRTCCSVPTGHAHVLLCPYWACARVALSLLGMRTCCSVSTGNAHMLLCVYWECARVALCLLGMRTCCSVSTGNAHVLLYEGGMEGGNEGQRKSEGQSVRGDRGWSLEVGTSGWGRKRV